ncbi:MAG: glutamyl-tRNA reductase [Deltaproteobacteria bacterium]|nr:glutamyl-tRNA reductase [Deltaproteobacteria bacterium]MBI3386440.1 glutamyl-tRNA reductase [Deltaproteobacteria bacterium]
MAQDIVIVGVNHRSAPVEIRERLALADGQLDDAHRRLLALGPIKEAVLLCTCNRVEVVAYADDASAALDGIAAFLAEEQRMPRDHIEQHLYRYQGRAAVQHLFRVAASLDSMVVGEPQILGQLKEFYARAAALGAVQTVLHRCFHKSFSTAKRIRTETGIASKAVSVSSAAVELARNIFDRLEDKSAMLIGAGEMSELAARHLLSAGVGTLIVTNRTFDRAVELAREFGGTPVPFEHFPRYLHLADVVIGSTAAPQHVLTPALIHEALRERKQRGMFLIDLSVPRSFDPAINDIDNVYLYDIDDLGDISEDNLAERQREAGKAELIVEAEVTGFWEWLTRLDAKPTIVALRERVEDIRRREVEKTVSALKDLTPRQREAIDALTSAIINKILHAPVTHLKRPDAESEMFYIDAARRLFDLGDPENKDDK